MLIGEYEVGRVIARPFVPVHQAIIPYFPTERFCHHAT
jgi:hypothetical protein